MAEKRKQKPPLTLEGVKNARLSCCNDKEFRNKFRRHYDFAKTNGFLYDIVKKSFRWNLEKATEAAKKCKNRTELQSRYWAAYRLLKKMDGLLDDLLPLVKGGPKVNWTMASLIRDAKTCSTSNEFHKLFPSEWNFAYSKGFLYDLFYKHRGGMTEEHAKEIAKTCQGRSELVKKSKPAYTLLKTSGLLDDILPELARRRKTIWTPEKLKTLAADCKTSKDFVERGGSYETLKRNNLKVSDFFPTKFIWSIDSLFEFSRTCSSWNAFTSRGGAYAAAKRLGCADKIKRHFPSGYRNPESVGGHSFSSWARDKQLATFYIVEIDGGGYETNFLKIGITLRKVDQRYSAFMTLPYSYFVAFQVDASPRFIWDLEKHLLRKLKNFHYVPNLVFGGYAKECFKSISSKTIIDMIST